MYGCCCCCCVLRKYTVLHPRTKGLIEMMKAVSEKNVECIVNVTIAYQDFKKGERINEIRYWLGRFPKRVLFHVECYTVKDIIQQYVQNMDNKNRDEYKYIPSNYYDHETHEEQLKMEQLRHNGNNNCVVFGTSNEIYEQAIQDFTEKTFYQREVRLKDWYENGNWIKDDKLKMNLKQVPYLKIILSSVGNKIFKGHEN